jgi:hypothetical protein
MSVSRERLALYVIWSLAALGCLLGVLDRPGLTVDASKGAQLLDLLRVLCTVALTLTLLFGPGLLWRGADRERLPSLGFLALPGLAIMIVAGIAVWLLGGAVDPELAFFCILGPILAFLLGCLISSGGEDLLDPGEQWALLIVGCALGFAVGRVLWSQGPEGELYAGGISRTLEVGNRSDSRISFIIPQLVYTHQGPYSPLATSFYAPYNFSSRGPLAGLGASPIVLMSGARPPAALPEYPWQPFDGMGFQAYRLAMMTFASTAFLSLWDLVRRLGNERVARLALLLAVTTPFLVHEMWFTWPKLLDASFVLLSAICVIERKPFRAGLLLGVGYLMHPAALVMLSGVGLLALWSIRGANWRRPDIKAALLLAVGVGISLLAWRLVNGSHYTQNGFTEYLVQAGVQAHPAIGHWLAYRADSVANTLVPMMLPLFSPRSVWINSIYGPSPFVIHFFFQYWDGVPFGVGILFFPLLVISIWRAFRRWTWPIVATIVTPFVAFTIYWGASQTGMLREGLHAWVLALIAVVALQQASTGFPWLRSKVVRVILTLRTVELLAIALVPALATGSAVLGGNWGLNDVVALLAMLGFAGALAWQVWTAPRRVLESR